MSELIEAETSLVQIMVCDLFCPKQPVATYCQWELEEQISVEFESTYKMSSANWQPFCLSHNVSMPVTGTPSPVSNWMYLTG